MPTCTSDLLIIGGGPAGLSAAINGASEGLNIRLIDNGTKLGGQAKESSGIENYPGFPDGITGDDLMGRMAQQARKFATSVITPLSAVGLIKNADGTLTVQCDDFSEYTSRSILLSMGLSYRRLPAVDIADFTGRGVFYGVPTWKLASNVKTVAIVGGANSAGQAALGLVKNSRLVVKLLIRSDINKGMSTYLIDRIINHPQIDVVEACEVKACGGSNCLKYILVQKEGIEERMDIDNMFIFIGAIPKTTWLQNTLTLDDKKFVITGGPVNFMSNTRPPSYYETSLAGVFAAGDIRSGSTKRIATSIGEGAGALQMIHNYLAQ